MAYQFISTDSLGPGTRVNLGTLDDAYIALGVDVASSDNFAVNGTGGNHRLTVHGALMAIGNTIQLGDSTSADYANMVEIGRDGQVTSGGTAIAFFGNNSRVVNDGLISGYQAIILGGTQLAQSAIINTGTIRGQFAAISAHGSSAESISLRNSGLIESDDWAYAAATGHGWMRITNTGTILGKIVTGSGADEVFNRGLIEGTIALGYGADLFDNRSGLVMGGVIMADGNDTARPGAETEIISGDEGSDTLDFRGSGAVRLALDGRLTATGVAAGDEYTGFEHITSGGLADVLGGDGGANALAAGSGADRLSGYAGADSLTGGAGRDTLAGGTGNDAFVYLIKSESGDVITDFHNASGDNDIFRISAGGFGGGLAPGALAAAKFFKGASNLAAGAEDRFVFRTTDRSLWFDADGNGAGAAVMIADLQAGASVTAADIMIF